MRGRDDSALDRAALSDTAAEVSSSKSGNGADGSRRSSAKSDVSGAASRHAAPRTSARVPLSCRGFFMRPILLDLSA